MEQKSLKGKTKKRNDLQTDDAKRRRKKTQEGRIGFEFKKNLQKVGEYKKIVRLHAERNLSCLISFVSSL